MPQPIGFARSNLFRVKDVHALREALQCTDIDINTYSYDGHLYVALSPDEGFWPDEIPVDPNRPEAERTFADLLAEHLVEGEVAILEAISHQGTKSLVATSVAVNAAGEVEETTLASTREDILARLKGQKLNAFTENLLPDGAEQVHV